MLASTLTLVLGSLPHSYSCYRHSGMKYYHRHRLRVSEGICRKVPSCSKQVSVAGTVSEYRQQVSICTIGKPRACEVVEAAGQITAIVHATMVMGF
jgi:hypothetical protein